MDKSNIKVAIIEDKLNIREKWQNIINQAPDMSCHWAYRDVEDATMSYEKYYDIDVVLMDIGLPGMSGIEGTKLLKDKVPNLDIIMLTVEQDEDILFEAFANGAVGYLVKQYTTSSPNILLEGIRQVSIDDGAVMSAQIARKVTNFFKERDSSYSTNGILLYFEYLSAIENRTLQLLAKGYTNLQISEQLSVKESDVKNYVKSIFRKLQEKNLIPVKNRVQATLIAWGIKF